MAGVAFSPFFPPFFPLSSKGPNSQSRRQTKFALGGTSSGRSLLEGSVFERGGRQTSPEQKLETSFMSSHTPSIAPTSSLTRPSQRVHHRCVEGFSRKSGQWTAPGHICLFFF